MSRATSCIEPLERRTLLDGAIEVWAGNTNLVDSWDPASAFLNIDQQGYTKIGESNAAKATVTFSSSTGYKYFVIATRGRVQVDSVRASSGQYLPDITAVSHWSNVDDIGNLAGAPNNTYAAIGTQTNYGTYAGYIVVSAPGTFTGVTVKTGTVEPIFQFMVDMDRLYLLGKSTSYGVHGDLTLRYNGLIQSARVHTPAGRWFDLVEDGEERMLGHEMYSTSQAELDALFGDGTYKLVLQTTVGARTYSFAATGVAYPTQIPSTSSFTHGKANTSTNVNVVLPTITDAKVNHVSLYISDANEEGVYEENLQPGDHLPNATLQSATSYMGELVFGGGNWKRYAGDYEFGFSKSNEAGFIFATTGFTQTTPDLRGITFSAAPTTANPGQLITLNIAAGSTGGMAFAAAKPVQHLIGLSKNKIIGDSDDVVLFAPIEIGQPAGWGFEGQMPIEIPDTATPGQYYVFGKMDSGNAVAESNEANNVGWSAAAVITVPPQAIVLDPVTHRLSIFGTTGADTIKVTVDAKTVHAEINGAVRSFAKSAITSVYVNGDAANDRITVGNGMTGVTIYGGDGNDSIYSGSGNDVIYGNGGDDRLFGQDGADSIYAGLGADSIDGGNHNDSLIGGDQSDTIIGNAGNDYIEGKGKADTLRGGVGNDTIVGGAGSNTIYGDDGDDKIYALNLTGFRDTISGGNGTDGAQRDSNDVLTTVEQVLA